MFLPAARRDGLTVRELTDETIVYDLERHKVHCLNRTAGLVWKHCDGQTTVAELAAMLKADQSVVHLALEQLGRRNLLQDAIPAVSETARRSRREVLKQLAVAAVALPVAMTITTKAAAQTGQSITPVIPCSGESTGNPCLVALGGIGMCCKGACVPAADFNKCGNCGSVCPNNQQICKAGTCCVPGGGGCSVTSDCCAGFVCRNGSCSPPV